MFYIFKICLMLLPKNEKEGRGTTNVIANERLRFKIKREGRKGRGRPSGFALPKLSPTLRLLCNRFPPGCPRIFLLSTFLRLNFSLLVSLLKGNFLEQTTLHLISVTLHATLALFLMNILPSLIRSHQFLSPAILIFVNSAHIRP